MNGAPFLKIAGLVVFFALVGGAVYAVQISLGERTDVSPLLTAAAPSGNVSAAQGAAVSVLVEVHNARATPTDVVARVSGRDLDAASALTTVPPHANATLAIPLRVPDALAVGSYPLTVRVESRTGAILVPDAGAFRLQVVEPPLALRVLREHVNATAGHDVSFPIAIVDRAGADDITGTVTVSGAGFSGVAPVHVPAGSDAGVFVVVSVPPSATPGTTKLSVRLDDASGAPLRTLADALRLTVLPASVGFEEGVTAELVYAGRFAGTGALFNTNDANIAPYNFSKDGIYRFSPGALPVTGGPSASVVAGFYEALLGIQAGESRSVVIPAEKAYGAATTDETLDRIETLERTFVLPIRNETVERARFDDYAARTAQAGPFANGSVFRFFEGPNGWPYVITNINATTVDYRLAVNVNETYSLYPFWENASLVTERNDTHATFFTTPREALGSLFTMKEEWPNMTALLDVTAESIVVRHDPTVGLQYTEPTSQFQRGRDATVKALTESGVVITVRASSPLAGHALVFDIFAVSLTK